MITTNECEASTNKKIYEAPTCEVIRLPEESLQAPQGPVNTSGGNYIYNPEPVDGDEIQGNTGVWDDFEQDGLEW